MIQNEKMVIEIKDKIYTLILQPFDENIDISNYLKIDYHNIFAELVTMPLIINQISNMKAEVDNMVAQQKLAIKVLKANLENECKASRGTKVSLNDLEVYVLTNDDYQNEASKLIIIEKQAAYMESFYWSAKSKMDSLMTISDKIAPDEFNVDILEKSINNVLIKKFNGKI